MSIHAPYNFVPLNEKVYTPDYEDQISHDIPFSDGVSGCIKLKLHAETPIFVRNGHTRQDAEDKNKTYSAFSHVEDHYFIPGTSIKGAIRSVFEILTASKMGLINNETLSIRLSGLNAKKTIKESSEKISHYLPNDHQQVICDLSDCLFGSIESDNSGSLKGRVHFGHAFTKNAKLSDQMICVYMASPKPTFYPCYLKQEEGKKLKTMLDPNAKLKGRKRYPVKEYSIDLPKDGDDKNNNYFSPIKEGAIFDQEVHFHNLKKEELGALLKTLTLREFSHSIGFAKPYGYGRVRVEMVSCKNHMFESISIDDYIKSFDQRIMTYQNKVMEGELLAMGKTQKVVPDLTYMDLEEHKDCIKKNAHLNYYSNLVRESRAKITSINPLTVILLDSNDKQNKKLNFNNPAHEKYKFIRDEIIVVDIGVSRKIFFKSKTN